MTKTRDLLAERQTTHGDYTINAEVSQYIMGICQKAPSWINLTPVQRETIHMIAHKIARIVGGNPNVEDHWRDIAGYAVLAADRIEKPTIVPVEDSNRHAFQGFSGKSSKTDLGG